MKEWKKKYEEAGRKRCKRTKGVKTAGRSTGA